MWRLDRDVNGHADVLIVSIKAIRAAFARCAFTGLSRNRLGLLLTELQPAWAAAREDRLRTAAPANVSASQEPAADPG